MSPTKNQYQAYSTATLTAPKTRQIVMLYDGAIRFIKQAETAIAEGRIEDRYKLLKRASDVMMGLQSSIDFEKGGEIAHILQGFYLNMSTRILAVNFHRQGGAALCQGIVAELKRMRDVWNNIDQTMQAQSSDAAPARITAPVQPPIPVAEKSAGAVTLSA